MTDPDPLDGLDDRFLNDDNLNDLQFYLDLIKTIGEPTRFAILVELLDAGNEGQSPKELAESLNRDETSLHQHLNTLADNGLVNNWKENTPDQHSVYSHYEISGHGLATLNAFESLLEEEQKAAKHFRPDDGGSGGDS